MNVFVSLFMIVLDELFFFSSMLFEMYFFFQFLLCYIKTAVLKAVVFLCVCLLLLFIITVVFYSWKLYLCVLIF